MPSDELLYTLQGIMDETLKCEELEEIEKKMHEIFRIPNPSELPRPGEVGSWEISDWESFLAPLGFVVVRTAKHGFVFGHPELSSIRSEFSKTPGDVRAGKNFARYLRSTCRTSYSNICYAAEMIAKHRGDFFECFSEEERKQEVPLGRIESMLEEATLEATSKITEKDIAKYVSEEALEKTRKKYERLWRLIGKLNDVGMRTDDVIKDMSPTRRAQERIIRILYQKKDPIIPVPGGLLEELEDLLEQVREEAKIDKERRKREKKLNQAIRTIVNNPEKTLADYEESVLRCRAVTDNIKASISEKVGQLQQLQAEVQRICEGFETDITPDVRSFEITIKALKSQIDDNVRLDSELKDLKRQNRGLEKKRKTAERNIDNLEKSLSGAVKKDRVEKFLKFLRDKIDNFSLGDHMREFEEIEKELLELAVDAGIDSITTAA